MSVDRALREMIRDEVQIQLRQMGIAELGSVKALIQRLGPLAQLMGGQVGGVRRGPGRPPKLQLTAGTTGGRRGRRAERASGEACAVKGCKRPSRTKGYCAAHYQKLRNLIKTGRRPGDWTEFPQPQSVEDVVLPRGRAGALALKAVREKK